MAYFNNGLKFIIKMDIRQLKNEKRVSHFYIDYHRGAL